jgi:hypothetical protein
MATVPQRWSFIPHPLALLAACLALGILAGHFLDARLGPYLLCTGILGGLTTGLFFKHQHGLATLSVCLAFIFAGATLAIVERSGLPPDSLHRFYDEGVITSGDPQEITGVITKAAESGPDALYLTIRVEKIKTKEGERRTSSVVELIAGVHDRRVTAEYEDLQLRYGARLRVMTALSRSETFRNPDVSTRTNFLEQRGFDAIGTIKSPLLIEGLATSRSYCRSHGSIPGARLSSTRSTGDFQGTRPAYGRRDIRQSTLSLARYRGPF